MHWNQEDEMLNMILKKKALLYG